MSEISASSIFPIISTLVFLSVILLMEAAYLFWQGRRGAAALRLKRRLGLLSQTVGDSQRTVLKQGKRSESPLARLLAGLPLASRLERHIAQSGLDWSVGSVIVASAGAVVLAIGVVVATASPIFLALVFAPLLGALPWAYIGRARGKRLRRLEQQLPDALDLIARAMRAGHSLPLGIQLLTEELPDPIAGEFRLVHEQVSFGVSLQQALANLCERVPLTDYRYFMVSVLIQRQSGGNLTEVLGNLSRLVRERLKLIGRVKVLSAEGRMSAWILGVLPFAIGGLLQAFNPQFMGPMWSDPLGVQMLQSLLAMMALGLLVLRRIVKIRV